MGVLPDFETFFSAYGSYHNNVVNKTIHIFCIPMIVFSLGQMLMHCTFFIDLKFFDLTIPIVLVAILSLIYIIIDFQSGLLSSIFYMSGVLIGNVYFKSLEGEALQNHFSLFLGIHVFCWICQFIGHGVFERRAPALLDNILQIFIAPDFVFIEILFLIGYKPQQKQNCQKMIDANIAEFRKKKQK